MQMGSGKYYSTVRKCAKLLFLLTVLNIFQQQKTKKSRYLRINNFCKLTYVFSNIIKIMKLHEFEMKETFIKYIFKILHKPNNKCVEFSVKCIQLAF